MSSLRGNRGYIPSYLTSIVMILIVVICVQFVSCDPVRDNPVTTPGGSHSDSHSGSNSWSYSWSDPDPSADVHSRQKRFCFLIFWLCTGGEGGSGGGGGWGGGAPGAPGGRN